ncbi:hypothetical protein RCO48_24900 [Peribacillus frigoritolerans]|nr:hypothetical protein [Peribacillus frigoritolerans]
MSSSNRNNQIGPPRFAIAIHSLVWLAQSEKAPDKFGNRLKGEVTRHFF